MSEREIYHYVWVDKHKPKPKWLQTHIDQKTIWYRYWIRIWDATPLWAEREKTVAVYREAARRREQGEDVVVDHIVPLSNPLVCGLHWHGNLQVIDRQANAHKSNHHWPDMPFQQLELEI